MRVVYLCIFVGVDFYSMKKGALKKKGHFQFDKLLVLWHPKYRQSDHNSFNLFYWAHLIS